MQVSVREKMEKECYDDKETIEDQEEISKSDQVGHLHKH